MMTSHKLASLSIEEKLFMLIENELSLETLVA